MTGGAQRPQPGPDPELIKPSMITIVTLGADTINIASEAYLIASRRPGGLKVDIRFQGSIIDALYLVKIATDEIVKAVASSGEKTT